MFAKTSILNSKNKERENYLTFDGVDDSLYWSGSAWEGYVDDDQNFSLSFWLKFPDTDYHIILGNTTGVGAAQDWQRLYLGTTGMKWYKTVDIGSEDTVHYMAATAPSVKADDLAANKWIHYVISWNRGTHIKCFMNGEECTYGSNHNDTIDVDISFGSTYYGAFAYVGGGVLGESEFSTHEIAVYNRSLTASEVSTIYNNRLPFNHFTWSRTPSCLAWYRFGDGISANSNGIVTHKCDKLTNGMPDSGGFTSLQGGGGLQEVGEIF
jgi:hypothetical protein